MLKYLGSVLGCRCADTQDEHGRWNNFNDDIDHDGHAIDWWVAVLIAWPRSSAVGVCTA